MWQRVDLVWWLAVGWFCKCHANGTHLVSHTLSWKGAPSASMEEHDLVSDPCPYHFLYVRPACHFPLSVLDKQE